MKHLILFLTLTLFVSFCVNAQDDPSSAYRRSLQVKKLIVVDSLRVSGTLTLNGAITQNANSTITGKLVVSDSARIGNMVTINNKLIVKDSARVGSTLTVQGATTINNKVVISDSIRAGSTATFNALLSGAQVGFSTVATKAIDSALAAVDTLKLGSVVATRIKVRGESGAVDSVTTVTGIMGSATAPVIYVFSAVADDTTVTFVDGSNLKLGAGTRVLDALTDRLIVESDGTNLTELVFISND